MKKGILFFIISLIFFRSYCQMTVDETKDFIDEVSTKLAVEFNSLRFDTKSFVGFYSFRFRITEDSTNNVFQGNSGMPKSIFDIVNNTIKSALQSKKIKAACTSMTDYYFLPIMLNYLNNPNDTVGLADNSFYLITNFGEDNNIIIPRYIILQPLVFKTMFHDGNRKFKKLYKEFSKKE